MRLICPNCDAQYEVVDDVIPSEGRDVQCSNCGQTWFQHHPDHAPAEPEEDEAPADLAPPDDTPAEDEERAEAPEPQRRELDPSVADILRQEAEIEAQARATDTEGLESQPDLGLDTAETEADRRAREARERMARMRGEETDAPEQVSEAVATAAAIGSRRDLLPDIEEINSTLRSTGDRQGAPAADAAADPAELAPRKSGFRRGFMLMVLLALILGAIYVFAPAIAQSVPQADPFLSAYVAQVDSARVWLDGQVAAGLTWLDNLTAAEGE
ncbi:zinc-ribbon domain-containing protein [uncultured Tateyamaria sp.]|uniref:zinc-ribbon domain-containing protein n=1 Tax=uncultured Tateyamaria sp. TaxID=455651 RepID=UPI002625443C|nr:zinc-ribbon domain-containing protein [uncultured Tateyamaria sp.]